MAQHLPFAEGGSINRPPLFCGENYPFWKVRMQIFMESIDRGIWKVVETGYTEPEKPYEEWTQQEIKLGAWDAKAKNIIHSALNSDEFFRISACKTAKEMWDHIQVVHEGTEEVKRSRKNTLIQEYETFRMNKGESISDVQKRFSHIVNHLKGLGKEFDEEEMNVKVLKALDRTWQAKVTAIAESKNLSIMKNAELFGKLREHEMDLQRLSTNEEKDRKQKGLALKSFAGQGQSESEDENDETTLIVQKFRKFMRKENSRKPKFNKNKFNKSRRQEGQSSSTFTCFECGKPGHIKTDCPELRKQKEEEKKSYKKNKKRAYITWDESASISSTSESESEEEANICLMAHGDSEEFSSEVSSSSEHSLCQEDFDELVIAFDEMYEEAQKFQKKNKELKLQIKIHIQNCKALEETVSTLEKDNSALKIENETISSNASKLQIMSNKPCENCKSLTQKLNTLENNLAKFSKAKTDLNSFLKTQRSMNDRTGLGYKKVSKKGKQKTFQNSRNQTIQSSITCNYCMFHGHISTNCNIKKYAVPQGIYTWIKRIPKGMTNNLGPKTVWVPKSF